ncbi:MAG: MerR family transcriptional regulator [Angelakisella sp.]
MNIKQVEQRTGITSKNIRFYEGAGLLHPQRNEQNSYREYTDEDVRRVKIIKMLRKLDMPLEKIREVLDEAQPLDGAVAQHMEYLRQCARELEAAQKVCRELSNRGLQLTTLDVDAYLTRISQLEREGETFADIVNDFKAVADSIEKMRFHFYPDELITTPEEFTDALLAYAAEHKADITVTKECMYPEFTMNGIAYKAMRYTGRFGSVISVEATNPQLLEPNNVPKERRWWMEWLWRVGFPLIVVLACLLIIVGSRLT